MSLLCLLLNSFFIVLLVIVSIGVLVGVRMLMVLCMWFLLCVLVKVFCSWVVVMFCIGSSRLLVGVDVVGVDVVGVEMVGVVGVIGGVVVDVVVVVMVGVEVECVIFVGEVDVCGVVGGVSIYMLSMLVISFIVSSSLVFIVYFCIIIGIDVFIVLVICSVF